MFIIHYYLFVFSMFVMGINAQQANLSFLYGNLKKYSDNKITTIFPKICISHTLYIDYSIEYNAYLVICNDDDQIEGKVLKIDPSEEIGLNPGRLTFTVIGSDLPNWFLTCSFDWIHGLFYYVSSNFIYVVDLKVPDSKHILLYKASQIEHAIYGLVVRPDVSKLFWLEFSEIKRTTFLFESSQSGKDVNIIIRLKGKALKNLRFDYFSDRFIATEQFGFNRGRQGVLIELQNDTAKVTEYMISYNTIYLIFSAQLFNDTFYLCGFDFTTLKYFSYSLTSVNSSNELNEFPLIENFMEHNYAIALIGPLVHPNITNRCIDHKCQNSRKDFCIPNTLDSFICESNLDDIHSNILDSNDLLKDWLNDYRWYMITTGIVFLLLLFIIFIILNKKKVNFYQIRLRNIKRVNSSKLEAKSTATLEIAE